MNSSTAGAALTRMAAAIDTQDWEGLAALLAPDFRARYQHTGEEFDGEQFVALNRDYPGQWRFVREVVVDAGSTAVVRARVSDAAEESPEVHYVASFGTVDDAGRLVVLEELWAEVVAPPQGDRRPDTAVGGRT
jgi:hypothetical protein